MKKNILVYVATAVLIVALGIFGYLQFASEDAVVETPVVGSVEQTVVNPFEHAVTLDKQQMYFINEKYSYFETNYMFAGEVDTLTTADIVFVANVFQTVSGNQPTVYCSRHYLDGTTEFEEKVGAFWTEDIDLNKREVVLTIEEAFDALMRSNCPKPRSKYCTLRAQVGPVPANAQYVFGNNNRGIVYVDAVTGEVNTKNPVFNQDNLLNLNEAPVEWTNFIYKQ